MKHRVAIIGKGNIGWAIKELLKNDYDIKQGDITDGFDARDIEQVRVFLKDVDAVISAGPFAINKNIGAVAAELNIGYFDLTEDVETTEFIRGIKSNNVMMPQCGLAPGAINICAASLMKEFDHVSEVMMRVGALPRFTTNEMSYYLSWSTNGLINEYCNEADAIYEGKSIKVMPLEGAEKMIIEGESYEAFNTSGGCATMCETFENKVDNLSYKTIRYPGHLNHMKFLFNDLHLKKNKDVLEKLFDKEVPRTTNDVIIFFVKVIGEIEGILQEKTYLRKIYGDDRFSAIQRTTASGVCSCLEMYFKNQIPKNGFTKQESIVWEDFTANQFGSVYL
ncbi:saccharopine dehydrogenase [Gammaproteobacteria bacterium]|jgi:saccharopine dehydrogenase-like NADP-dependent oxidoreductase|nr:saccharopine dehydrogenase [Gammaproteobacteria bacterium]MDC0367270.1 saccharopine dehydrogenase [Gammaproteobacteria bacterium]MDC3302072.1 saccharopine dehydrogenase [Gammaproteobacteria bacterium]